MEAKYFGKVNRVDVANKTNFRPKFTLRYFTNTQNWQNFHHCQLYISIYLQFRSLFAPCDVNKTQWAQGVYISMLHSYRSSSFPLAHLKQSW